MAKTRVCVHCYEHVISMNRNYRILCKIFFSLLPLRVLNYKVCRPQININAIHIASLFLLLFFVAACSIQRCFGDSLGSIRFVNICDCVEYVRITSTFTAAVGINYTHKMNYFYWFSTHLK